MGDFIPPTEAAARPFTEFRDDKGHLDLDHVERAKGEYADLREENDHLELIAMAARKCGQFLLAMTKATGGDAMRARLPNATEGPQTLTDIGIKKNQSVRLQCMALVPEDDFVNLRPLPPEDSAHHLRLERPGILPKVSLVGVITDTLS